MRKFFVLAVYILMVVGLCAQSHNQIKDVSLTFPDSVNQPDKVAVSFIWHTQNPDTIDVSQFKLQIDDSFVNDFNVEKQEQQHGKGKKSILFLWEDMKSHSKQSEFTQKTLLNFFQSTRLDPDDEFCIAVFNRCSGKQGEPTIIQLIPGFTSNLQELVSAIKNHTFSQENFSIHSLQTDLYLAVDEGIEFLNKQSPEKEKIIVLFSAGQNIMSAGSRKEMGPVLHNAITSDIPVYVVSYAFKGNSNDLESLSKESYGLFVPAVSSDKLSVNTETRASEIAAILSKWYNQMSARAYGQDYRFNFTTTQLKRDGLNHPLTLTVSNTPYTHQLTLPEPSKSFGTWVREHLIWVILTGVLLAAVVVFLILLIHWKSKKLKSKGAADKAQLEGEIARSHEMIDDLQRQRYDEKRQAEEEAARKAAEEHFSQLAQLMQTKNLHPRLRCNVPGVASFSYTIGCPMITMGRNADNNLQLNHPTVSGHHADISFDGRNFTITNRSTSYSQGVVINGQFYRQYALNNGDMIQLGQVIITFYL